MNENIIPYKGGESACLPDPKDKRDIIYDEIVAAAPPVKIDWEKGFDVRNVLNGDIKFKCQQGLSCVGNGWSYYVWVKQVIEMMSKYIMDLTQLRKEHKDEVDEISSKAIYSQIFISPAGGAYIRDGAKLVINWGSLFERIVPSTDPTRPKEEFVRDLLWKTAKMDELAKTLQGTKYATINAANNMDLFAQAILENHGVVGGIVGQNGCGWNTENPSPPKTNGSIWRHCVWYGAIGTDEKGRFIATPNSWGNAFQSPNRIWKKGDLPGDGWQKLREDYFNNKYQFNPWTYVDKININNNMDLTKLHQAKNQGAKVFVSGIGDNLYHHIDFRSDEQAKALLGNGYDSRIEMLDEIRDDQIGFAIHTKDGLLKYILDFFKKTNMKGREATSNA